MKKIMLIYPPVGAFQRSEDRCQIDISASVANNYRACNDLGYIASVLKNQDYEIFLKDYSAEKDTYSNFEFDFSMFVPDIVFISTTNGSIYEDLDFIKKIKNLKNDIVVILKGAIFFNAKETLFDELDLTFVDYLIGGEVEFIISDLLKAHYNCKDDLFKIQGISFKTEEKWHTNNVEKFCDELDSLPFPDRNLIKNELYINQLTNKTMATISTSRGCPSNCIYCLSPIISGKNVRYRTPNNVLEELKDCFLNHNISDFFFKSDTFTINKAWVLELCDLIINSELNGKINWVANSKVNTLDEEMLLKMKQAGCSVIALGIESGSQETLEKIKKNTTIEQARNSVKLIKKVGLKIFGFYLVGFPWENSSYLQATKEFIFELDTDYIELSIATPFNGTELYSMCDTNVLGYDSFNNIIAGNDYLTKDDLEKFRKDVIFQYHLRPSFILKKIFDKNLTINLFLNYIKYGLRLLKNLF
ncbi:MAG: radical SAM protein [Cyanobacteria bacterium SIG29]|nr:radical SAM protein [Cyanobacteria bacterium SIG29]